MFVIGYSFKDDHIARLFRYAARKNRELIVFLISPSASIIYNQKLKYHDDEEFLKSFTVQSFGIKSFTRPVRSALCGRVIRLNYEFKKILPYLKDGYLKHLIEAEKLESKAKYVGSETEKGTWKNQLAHYTDCEHMDKVNEKINVVGWDKIVSDDWRFSFEISFKGLLNSLVSDDNDIKNKWPKYFEEVSKIFSIDKFIYQPSLGGPSTSFPPHIKLELRNTYWALAEYNYSGCSILLIS